MRISGSIIKDLSIIMVGFGAVIGIIFPFFTWAFGAEKSLALSPFFFGACVVAGVLVGGFNIFLTRSILVKRLDLMTDKMHMIKDNVVEVAQGSDSIKCDLDTCLVEVDSEDAMGNNARAYNQLVEVLALKMSGEELLEHLDMDVIMDKAVCRLLETTKAFACAVLMEHEGELEEAYSDGFKSTVGLLKNKTVLKSASQMKRTRVELPDDVKVDALVAEMKPKEVLVEPLCFNSIRIGVLVIATMDIMGQDEMNQIGILARTMSLAMQNAIAHEQIQRLAAIDPLTAVYNRRFGEQRLEEEYYRSIKSGLPMGMIMCDLDYFKKVNDTYGHLAGDKVLVQTARLIKNVLREGDVVIRYGGEEFLLLLPGASLENTLEVANKIRRIIEENPATYSEMTIPVTASLGVGACPELVAKTAADMLEKVDKALYASKANGRNQVTVYNG